MSSSLHPALHPYEALLGTLGSAPDLAALNACALARERVAAHGARLRFVRAAVPASGGALEYERSIVMQGEIPTRDGNAHDIWNAFAWLRFPRTKLALSRLHVGQGGARAAPPGPDLRGAGPGGRGRVRDAATLLDESGALVLASDSRLVDLWRAHEWRSLFHDRAGEVLRSMRIAVIGHGVLARLAHPFPALTLRVLVIPGELPEAAVAGAASGILDLAAAGWLEQHASRFEPRDLIALPVAAWPGWDWQGRGPARFDDTRVYRPPRSRAPLGDEERKP